MKNAHPIKSNLFYNEFDCEFFKPRRGEDYRTAFQRDRDRIIYSSALRRLQAKTQVFLPGEYDFYRTRLTHSIEVAQIGRSICNFLQHQSSFLSDEFYIDANLVEAVCLAHDLGHPPFGHAGESTLNRLMRDYGGFEGNAQTLRSLTEIIYPDRQQRTGMNPTRAVMDGVMKYKTLISQFDQPERYFLYDDQAPYLNFVFDKRPFPSSITPGKELNHFRSIECEIMDWADDTAYSLHDIIDGVNARFISGEQLEKWGNTRDLNDDVSVWLQEIMRAIREGTVERTFSRKIGDFISACRLEKRKNFMSDVTNRYRFQLAIDDNILAEAAFYKQIASDIVFNSPQLQQLIYKWKLVLEKIFIALQDNYLHQTVVQHKLIQESTHKMVLQAKGQQEQMRIICDHIAGMTDGFAIRTYKRLFNPDSGSFADLI